MDGDLLRVMACPSEECGGRGEDVGVDAAASGRVIIAGGRVLRAEVGGVEICWLLKSGRGESWTNSSKSSSVWDAIGGCQPQPYGVE